MSAELIIRHEVGKERMRTNKNMIMAFLALPIPNPDNLDDMPSFDTLVLRAHQDKFASTEAVTKRMSGWRTTARNSLIRFWNSVSSEEKFGHERALAILEEAAETNPDVRDVANVRRILDHYKIPIIDERIERARREERKKAEQTTIYIDPTALPQPNIDPSRLEEIDGRQFADHLLELRRQRERGIRSGFIGDPSKTNQGESIPNDPLADWGSKIGRRTD